jgi:predicted RNA binding protein YcfA (HicA-like mRNA interferase family)
MPPLPSVSGHDVVPVFEGLGWHVVRQRDSHVIMIRPAQTVTRSVPSYDEIAKGTLRSLIRSAGRCEREQASRRTVRGSGRGSGWDSVMARRNGVTLTGRSNA